MHNTHLALLVAVMTLIKRCSTPWRAVLDHIDEGVATARCTVLQWGREFGIQSCGGLACTNDEGVATSRRRVQQRGREFGIQSCGGLACINDEGVATARRRAGGSSVSKAAGVLLASTTRGWPPLDVGSCNGGGSSVSKAAGVLLASTTREWPPLDVGSCNGSIDSVGTFCSPSPTATKEPASNE